MTDRSPSLIEIVIRPKGIDRYLALVEGEAVITSRQPLFAQLVSC